MSQFPDRPTRKDWLLLVASGCLVNLIYLFLIGLGVLIGSLVFYFVFRIPGGLLDQLSKG